MNHRVVIADGAMGTILQGRDLSLEDDFQGLEGCNEILNDARPDVLADIHDAYSPQALTPVETNTFGANWLLLDEDEESVEPAPSGGPVFGKGRLAFDNVSFSYSPDKPLISGLSLVACPASP